MIAAEEASFAFHTTFFVALTWRTELGLEAPVRAERDEARRLLALMPTQDLLYGALEVVIAQTCKHAAEIAEGQLMCFQESLLARMRVSPMESASTAHTAHAEDVALVRLPA